MSQNYDMIVVGAGGAGLAAACAARSANAVVFGRIAGASAATALT